MRKVYVIVPTNFGYNNESSYPEGFCKPIKDIYLTYESAVKAKQEFDYENLCYIDFEYELIEDYIDTITDILEKYKEHLSEDDIGYLENLGTEYYFSEILNLIFSKLKKKLPEYELLDLFLVSLGNNYFSCISELDLPE